MQKKFFSKSLIPNIEKPAYTCVNQCTKGCIVAYCDKSFVKGKVNSLSKPSSRIRRFGKRR